MKKILIYVVLAVMATTGAFAQEEGRMRGSINAGSAIPGIGFGGTFDTQFGYNLRDNMNVGVKWAVAGMFRANPNDEDGGTLTFSANVNYLATFTYFFNNGGRFAPFVGCGLGIFRIGGFGFGDESAYVVGGRKFGGLLTAGVEMGRFRLAVEYNLIPSSELRYAGQTPAVTSIPNSYLGITVGFVIGGGRWGR